MGYAKTTVRVLDPSLYFLVGESRRPSAYNFQVWVRKEGRDFKSHP